MSNLLWVGNPFFASYMADFGWQVRCHNPPKGRILNWEALVHAAGAVPDVLIVADKSLPPFVVGMEHFPCLTVFYAVDTHLHRWYADYAQAFDACMVSLRDDLPLFAGQRLPDERLWWFPPYAGNPVQSEPCGTPEAPPALVWDTLFVGSLDPARHQQRLHFLQQLGEHVPIHCTSGPFAPLYAQARVIINHAVNADLNFRVFEAMGCGRCLVTPRVGHGQADLFQDGLELLTYEPNSVASAATAIRSLLDAPERMTRMRTAALAAIDARHRAGHRARTLHALLRTLLQADTHRSIVQQRQQAAPAIHATWLKLLYLLLAKNSPVPELKATYLQLARG